MPSKLKTLPIERMIRDDLRFRLKNPKIKVDDIQEWCTSEELFDKNLREDELKFFICGVYVAVKKAIDKRPVIA